MFHKIINWMIKAGVEEKKKDRGHTKWEVCDRFDELKKKLNGNTDEEPQFIPKILERSEQ